MISIDISDSPDSKWNERLIESGIGSIKQAAIIDKIAVKQGKKPLFLKFLDDNGKIAGQLFIKIFPYGISRKKSGRILNKFIGKNQELYRWNFGPIIFHKEKTNEILLKLGDFLNEKRGKVLGTTNPLSDTGLPTLNNSKISKWSTIIIDLKKSKEELYGKIDKHGARKNIERSLRRGVTVEEITDREQLNEYNRLRNQIRRRLGVKEKSIENMVEVQEVRRSFGLKGFLAKKDGETVGGISFNHFCKHIIEIGIIRTKKDFQEKLYSQDLLKWKIIEWGVENNMNYFNLAGFNPNPINKKEEGIKRYKEKWGGDRRDYWIIST